MGMDKGGAKLLLSEALQRPFKGQLLTLGRQDVHFTFKELQKAAKELGAKLHEPCPITFSNKAESALKGHISDETFFKALGFSDVAAMDYSPFESARYIFDLNSRELPEHLLAAFDVIIDGGTIEHVFHLPNALNNIHRMLRPHGRIIHLAPSSNYMDHGFYMFSPTLFWDFYRANNYKIKMFQVFTHTRRPAIDPWEVSDYEPGCLNQVSFGGLDDKMYGIFCVAMKNEDSTGDNIPQQGAYMEIWGERDVVTPPTVIPQSHPLKGMVKRIPIVSNVLRSIYIYAHTLKKKLPRRKGLGLKVVARY
jgi:SAM-dependent methyltransferase